MLKMAHIVNQAQVDETSDLSVAQPITFETMRTARDFAAGEVDVQLFAVQYADERTDVPPGFLRAPDLDRSVLDVGRFRPPRKLALLDDILARLYAATDADYLIYTNVDIGLQPHFYTSVHDLITEGNDAFVVNRRTIDRAYDQISEIPLMYQDDGHRHRGWDCFIFPRSAFPKYDLGNVCIGAPRVGLALLSNLLINAETFREFKELHLTFHLGDYRNWSRSSFGDYATHNTREVVALLSRLEKQYGKFDRRTPPGRFLFRRRFFGPLYETAVRLSNSVPRI